MKTCTAVVLALFVAGSAVSVWAQQSGAVPVRIDNGPEARCIDGKADQIWLTLYRVVTTKSRGFLSQENQAQLLIKVQVSSDPQTAQTMVFPLAARVNMRNYSAGQVSLPVEYTLIRGLALRQREDNKTISYTGMNVDTTIVNVQSRNGLGTALQALTDLTGSDKLPIPDSPYRQAAGYLLRFANNAVQNDIDAKNADDKLTTSSLSLNFDPEGKCADDGPDSDGFERTGTKAILSATGAPGNLIPIDRTQNYCWSADVRPAFVLKATPRIVGKTCDDPAIRAALRDVTNDYIAYFLQKRRISTSLAPNRTAIRDDRESTQLCKALGVEVCPNLR